MTTMLSIGGLWKSFAGFVATRDVSFELLTGENHAIIGPNGAGKTTFFNLITGHLRPDRGNVSFEGRDLVGLPPQKIVRLGIARSFQRINIYPRLTVFENVQVALIAHEKQQWNLIRPGRNSGPCSRSARTSAKCVTTMPTQLTRKTPCQVSAVSR